jgi:hypothetical protein
MRELYCIALHEKNHPKVPCVDALRASSVRFSLLPLATPLTPLFARPILNLVQSFAQLLGKRFTIVYLTIEQCSYSLP